MSRSPVQGIILKCLTGFVILEANSELQLAKRNGLIRETYNSILTYLLTHSLTYSLHGAGYYLKS